MRSLAIALVMSFALTAAAEEETPTNPIDRIIDAWGNDDGPTTPWDAADQLALEVRRSQCVAENGEMTETLSVAACVDGKTVVTIGEDGWEETCGGGDGADYLHQCVHRDEAGHVYFNDGPSAPALPQALSSVLGDKVSNWRWNQAFWSAGVNHDYCYHHNPSTYGKSREQCDWEFYIDMKSVCAVQLTPEERDGCRANAALSYVGVRFAGATYYNAMDVQTQYPEWTPLWQTLGLEEEPTDEKLDSQVQYYDSLIDKLPSAWVGTR